MSRANLPSDLRLVLNGILKVANSGAAIRRAEVQTILKNSSLKNAAENAPNTLKKVLPNDLQDVVQRASMIPVGIQQFVAVAPKYILPENFTKSTKKSSTNAKTSEKPASVFEEEEVLLIREEDLEGMYIQSLGVELLQQNEDGRKYEEGLRESGGYKDPLESQYLQQTKNKINPEPIQFEASSPSQINEGLRNTTEAFVPPKVVQVPIRKSPNSNVKPLSKNKPTSQLGETSKQRKVPATRISRLVSYGGLAAGLGVGALTEMAKRSLGLNNPNSSGSLLESSPFLTEANAERIVDTLCRVRGAALKIGQILSIQDNSLINPQLQKVFERVRHAADFMPDWQMEKMMVTELGIDWRSKLADFDSKPFAAASIGQVHLGKMHDGRPIAIKIQYPGVGQGINSDIDNLIAVLNVWNIIPEGVFIDNVINVAKRELSWEVDYLREAKCAKRFRKLLEPYTDYYVPDVIDEFTTKQVYSTELIEGIPVDKCESLDQETRNHICFLMLDLFFRELFEFQFMQTDPNWANFLYNAETKQIGLLDFGASRDYGNSFVDNYMRILEGAAEADREVILKYSRNIGFLSGYESKIMENAHTETVLLLGEALRMNENPYDFGSQDLTMRIQRLVPVMVKERLCPPPEEIYSLHRKLSGIFLLCNRLRGQVRCRQIFERVRTNYTFDRPDTVSQINV